MPLFIGNLHFGFAVFLIDDLQKNVFESLCEQISHSLNRQLLLDKRKKAEEVFIYNAINIINGHLQIMKV